MRKTLGLFVLGAVMLAATLPARAQTTAPPSTSAVATVAPASTATLVSDGAKLAQDVTANAPAATINADVAQIATDSGHATATLDHGKVQFNIAAATGLDVMSVAKGSNGKSVLTGPTQGAGGVLFDFGVDKASDGNSRVHFSPALLLGAGVFDGKPAPVVTLGGLIGFGGFEHIPLFSVGPGIAAPLAPNQPPVFQILASVAAVFEIQQIAGN